MEVPRTVPAHHHPASPAIATARQLQQHLADRNIVADIRSHRGVAVLLLDQTLNVWCTPTGRIMWDSGTIDPATGTKVCVTVPSDQADQAAGLIVARFRQIRAGQV